ncbi:MAG: DUF308 domain-containing protein [Lachnospiraceae bacterium]|nr:DUF308 domain-containing protein [Lachnospiraceae bacterium]
MLIIVLIFTGLTLFLVPESFIPFLGKVFAFVLLVEAVVRILEFIGSRKALIHYIRLILGLLAGFVGIMLFAVDGMFLAALNLLVGLLPILLGAYGVYHALLFAKRSGRKGWWVYLILSCLLILFGAFVFMNPWADDPLSVMRVIAGTLTYSAVVYGISLIWIWPFQNNNRGDS